MLLYIILCAFIYSSFNLMRFEIKKNKNIDAAGFDPNILRVFEIKKKSRIFSLDFN